MRASSLCCSTAVTTLAIRSALRGGSSNSAKISRACGIVIAGVFPPQPPPFQFQEPQRQQRQRHVVVPAHPTAHFVVSQAHLPLPPPQQLLDSMPCPMRPCQFPTLG